MRLRAFFNKNSMRLYLLLAFISLELLMSFSFLGYIHIEPISITIAYIPVMLAGAILGIPDAVVVGAVFGLSSMWKAGANYVQPVDQLFSPFMSGYPIESLILSIGSRMLFGLLIGVLFFLAKRIRFTWLWVCMVAFFGKLLHAFLVYGCMGLFFPESGYSAASALQNIATPSDLATNLLTSLIVLLFWRLAQSKMWQQFYSKIQKVQLQKWGEHYHKLFITIVVLLAIVFSMFVGIYFVNRMDRVLSESGIVLSDTNYADLLHLQTQFLIGVLAIMMLIAIILLFNRQYVTYIVREADVDQLTGVMTRTAFFRVCQKALISDSDLKGYFVMFDLDYFKQINDQYGHPKGDQILRDVAWRLREIFGQYGPTGRLGGDEFAVFLQPPFSKDMLETNLNLFLDSIHNIDSGLHTLSCSIGVTPVKAGKKIDELYQEADGALYRAKQQGRGCYVIESSEATPPPPKKPTKTNPPTPPTPRARAGGPPKNGGGGGPPPATLCVRAFS